MTSITANQLWQFSLDFYPKVQTTCLAWQDNFKANVNLLLLLCYLEQQQLSISQQTLFNLSQSLTTYNIRITQRVRQLRRKVSRLNTLTKQQQLQFKQHLLAVELIAEQQEQQRLVHTLTANLNLITNSCDPLLELYLQQLCQPLTRTAQLYLTELRQALAL